MQACVELREMGSALGSVLLMVPTLAYKAPKTRQQASPMQGLEAVT